MYYSKNTQGTINIPKNYSGNTFRVIDESDRTYPREEKHEEIEEKTDIYDEKKEELKAPSATAELPLISSLLKGISVEDILILGLIFVIHQENPNDSTLILLLILLLAK